MPYGYRSRFHSRRFGHTSGALARRQGGTGAAYSGSQDLIRHSVVVSGSVAHGETTCVPIVCYNPTRAGTPYNVDGSSAKTRLTAFTDLGSRVDYVTLQLTLTQSDTSKNNTCYIGTISTSFNEARLSDDLMENQFGNGSVSFVKDEGDGEMNSNDSELPMDFTLSSYSVRDIVQHNVRGLLSPQFQLYSGRVVTANQTIPLPFKNRRQQEGSGFWLVIMNDSTGSGDQTDINYRLDTFFKEIPSTSVS